jgi:hypothetical protein
MDDVRRTEAMQWLTQYENERRQNLNDAKAALFDHLSRSHPHITHILVRYSGSGDEGWIDELNYYNAKNEAIADINDEKLVNLVDDLFCYVTPDGFENNEGGDGEVHIYPGSRKAVVEHNYNIIHQESETYEV